MSAASFTLLVLTLYAALVLGTSSVVPQCATDDEDCRDRYMHPDFFTKEEASAKIRALDGEENTDYWRDLGKHFVAEKLAAVRNVKKAKNVIMFLGDGMGLTTLAATRNVMGGEHEKLSFEKFPYVGLSKTYSVDKIVPDSACTATAYLCGIKANEGTMGVNANVERKNCETVKDPNNHVYSIAKWAMEAGKWAGVVTTTRITHASPGAVYAHIADRDWEDDTEVKAACGANSGVEDIAYQLVHGEVGSKLKFVMGGGKKHFLTESGSRSDNLNLIDDYQRKGTRNMFVETRSQMMSADMGGADRVFGLFQDDHLLYHMETNDTTDQPTLEEMTRKAIEYLSRNDEGYFIFIEGGRIDLAHHDNLARIALDETVEFSKAIQAARDMTSEDDTLIVVTSDHSHTLTFNGYPYRGSDIFGRAPATPTDSVPYMVLSYANGPSFDQFYDTTTNKRRNPLDVIKGEAHDMFPSTVPLDSETHGGDDVGVFASGPWAHLFTGVYEQNTIPHMMGYASCLGSGATMCDN